MAEIKANKGDRSAALNYMFEALFDEIEREFYWISMSPKFKRIKEKWLSCS